MAEYECMLLLDAELDEAARTTVVDRAKAAVTKSEGTWGEVNDWGRRTLAYPINHKTEAHYSLLLFEGTGATVEEMVRQLRITDGVVRANAYNRIVSNPELDKIEFKPEEQREGGRGRRRER